MTGNPSRPLFHPAAWLLWGAATGAIVLLTRNPLYLLLLLLALLWIRASLRAAPLPIPPRFLALMPLLGAAATALTVHLGETVLTTLPRGWPLLGGPLTAESIVSGALAGAGLVVLLVLFATLGAGTSRTAALRLMPAFLFQAGFVTTMALAFVPQTLRALSDIREAQQIRGRAFRGWRDLPPLFLPLLTTGLERSIGLAEAMESRGFGATLGARRPTVATRALLLAGLLAVVAGVGLTLLSPLRLLGYALLLLGIVVAVVALRRMGRGLQRTHYRAQPWQRRDLAVAATALLLLAGLVALLWRDPAALTYYPFPRLTVPPFDPLLGLGMVLVGAPALLARW